MLNKKTISPVVATALLIVVTVVAIVGFQGWYQNYQSQLTSDVNIKSSQQARVNIESIGSEGILYVTNTGTENVSVDTIKIGGIDCSITQELISGVNQINVSSCLNGSGTQDVIIVTDNGIINKKIFVDDTIINNLAAPFSCLSNTIEGFYGGTGTLVDPWQICNCSMLQKMNSSLYGNYTLISDIDCLDTINWDGGLGFYPIGHASEFSGSLDGQGYEIDSLYINRPTENYFGLFSSTNSNSFWVLDFGLTNVNITGAHSIGALGGDLYGISISNVYAIGYVNSLTGRAGGLIGYVQYMNINNTYFIGEVYGDGGVGGLIGYPEWSNISNSYSVSIVNGTTDVGGLIGESRTNNIINSYATGEVNGVSNVGGFIGRHRSGGLINNSFSTGNVSAGSNVGGFIGNYTIDPFGYNNYWNNHSNNPSVGLNHAEVNPIADNEAYFYSNSNAPMDSWDNNAWAFSGSSYPTLK